MAKDKPSASELRQYLEEAGSYDPTLNNQEMYQLYETLEISKNTASQDDEHRSILLETEANCSLLEDLRKNSVLVEEVSDPQNTQDPFDYDEEVELTLNKVKETTKKFTPRKSESSNTVLLDLLKETCSPSTNKRVDFNDVDICNPIPSPHKPLKRIEVPPIYKNPFYCRPEILALNYCERERLIGEFHSKLLSDLNTYQKQSVYPASWGKPIQANSNFNGSLSRKLGTTEDSFSHEQIDIDSDVECDEVFTTRAGRQTKRKFYTENFKEDADLIKKVQPTNSVRKRPSLSTLKNSEIIKRSKLFADSPSRTEKMFDNLLADEPKKLEAEQEIETYKASLNHSSDEENTTGNIAEIIDSEEPFQKRRIEPPLRKKFGTKNKPSGRGGKGGTTRKPNKKTDASEVKSQTYTSLKTTTTNVNNKIKKGECPLCNEKFFQDELEDHASACCETLEGVPTNKVTTRRKVGQNKTITCETCDEVFPLTTDYEVHVKECIDRDKRN